MNFAKNRDTILNGTKDPVLRALNERFLFTVDRTTSREITWQQSLAETAAVGRVQKNVVIGMLLEEKGNRLNLRQTVKELQGA